VLIRARAVAWRSLETSDEKTVDRDHATVEIDPAPPVVDCGVIAGLRTDVVISVDRPQRDAEGGANVVEVVVVEVATADDQIDRADLRSDRRGDRLVLDVADREDPHPLSVSASLRT